MILSVLAYALALFLALAFYFFYPGYLSFYVLVLFAALPVLSLIFALVQRRRWALGVFCPSGSYRRGETVRVRFVLTAPTLSGETARLTVRIEPLLYPELAYTQVCPVSPGEEAQVEVPLEHCGWYKLTVTKCRITDWLGCIPLPLAVPSPVLILAAPQGGLFPAGVELEPKSGAALRPRPGGGPGEEYELRPYRPGDPVNAIHWKLTAKQPTDEPVLRETLEPVRERLAVVYDHVGPPEELDKVLDQLAELARFLLDKEFTFTVCCMGTADGGTHIYDVDCQKAWDDCYRALAALPASQHGPVTQEVPVLPGRGEPVKYIRLTPEGGQEVTGR